MESTGLFGPSLLCWEKERAKERRGRAAHRTSPADRIFILLPAAGVVHAHSSLPPPLGQAGPRRRKREGAEEAEPAFPWWPALFRPHRRQPSFCTCTPSSPFLFLCFSPSSPANNTSPTEGTQTHALAVHNSTADTTTTIHFRVLPAASICRHCHASLFRASLSSRVLFVSLFWASLFGHPLHFLGFVCLDCLSTSADSLLHSTTDERIFCIDFTRPYTMLSMHALGPTFV